MFYCFKALNLAQIQIPEGGQHNDRVTHVCSAEVRPVQIRPSEVRRANVRCLEPCSRQVCHSEGSALLRFASLRCTKVRSAPLRVASLRNAHSRFAPLSSAQLR